MQNKRLYSTITIKAADADQWSFTGIASTPAPDRMRDTVDPKGATFELPLPLLWQHDHASPIGHVTRATVGDDGIQIEGRITQPDDDMPRGMASRLREAWSSIKSELVRGLSIGFVPTQFEPNDGGGMNITAYDLMEVSAVTIPANAEATIQNIKSFSAPQPKPEPHGGFALRKTHFYLRNT